MSEPAKDIYAAIKAKRDSIDWDQVHIRADRRQPIFLPTLRRPDSMIIPRSRSVKVIHS